MPIEQCSITSNARYMNFTSFLFLFLKKKKKTDERKSTQ